MVDGENMIRVTEFEQVLQTYICDTTISFEERVSL